MTLADFFKLSCQLLFLLFSIQGNAKTKKVTAKHPKMIRTQGKEHGSVYCRLQDKAGNIWFGTDGEGAYFFDGKSFKNFTTKNGLSSNYVNAIIQDKAGSILLATGAGVSKYNGKSFVSFTENKDVNINSITSLLEDRNGNIWMGTMESGVFRYDGKSFKNFLNNDDHTFNLGCHFQTIVNMLQDKSGNIWFCSFNGGGVWRYDGKSFKNYLPPPDYYSSNEDERQVGRPTTEYNSNYLEKHPAYIPSKNYIADDMIFSASEDRKGNIWFATRRHGVCCYDGKSFSTFREKEGFVNRGIYTSFQDKKGNIWLTTESKGVFRYDGKTFKNYTTTDGLICNAVLSALEDKAGNIWFGTREFGLSRYDGKTFTDFSRRPAKE